MSETNLNVNITASDSANAQIRGLQTSVRTLAGEIERVSAAGVRGSEAYIAILTKEIGAINQQIAALRAQAAVANEAAASMRSLSETTVRFGSTLEGINNAFGITDRAIKSASDSARVLSTSLSAAAEADARLRDQALATTAALERQSAVRSLSGAQFFGGFERRQGIGQPALSAQQSAGAFERELGPAGTGITTVATQKTIEDLHGVNRELLSAKESAAAFQTALGAAGTGIATTATRATIDSLHGIGREMLSAKESAAVFERELGAVGTGITSIGAKGVIDTLHGIGREMLSAKDSAAVFQRELGAVGTGVTQAGTRATIDAWHGISREMLSARDSAAVFERELSAIGTAVRTIPSAGFSKMVADLADVKQSYLSAAQSAEVFAREGLTATERSLGMTEASIAAETAVERGTARAAAGMMNLNRQASHGIAIFDSLARGQHGQVVSSIGAAMRDAGISASGLAIGVGGLVAVMGTGAILRSAEHLGKFATEARAAASAAGMSLEAYTSLAGAFDLVGLKGGEGDAALRHLAETLNTALADPASLAAQAFHNLGISQEQLIKNGQDTGGAMNLLAEAFARTADGANKSANMAEIFGRGFERIIPLLQNGKEGLNSYEAEAKKLGLTLSNETAAKLEDAGRAVDHLSATMKGEGMQAVAAWSGAIVELTHVLAAATAGAGYFASAIAQLPSNIATVMGAVNQFFGATGRQSGVAARGLTRAAGPRVGTGDTDLGGGVLPGMGPGVGEGDTGTVGKAIVPPLVRGGEVTALEQMRQQMAKAAEMASSGGGTSKELHEREEKAQIAAMQQTLATAKLTATQRGQVETELSQKITALHNTQASGGGAAAKQETRDFIAEGKLKIAEANGNATKIAAIYDDMLAHLRASHTATAAQIANIEREKVNAVNKATLDEIKEGAKQEEQAERLLKLNNQLAAIAGGKAKFAGQPEGPTADVDRSQAAIKEAEQVRSSAAQQIAALTQVRDTSEEGSATQKTAIQEITNLTIASKQREVQLYMEAGAAAVAAANKTNAAFKTMFDGIGSQFENFSKGLLDALIAPQQDLIKAGLTTIKFSEQGNEIRTAARNALLGVVNDFAQSLETALGHVIANALSSGAANTIGELLSQTIGKAISSITGNAAGSALGNVAGSAAGNVAQSTAVTTAIATAATTETTGISAAVTTAATTQTAALTAGVASIVGAIGAETTTLGALLVGLNAKPSALGFTYASGGIVPSAAGGMVGGTGASLAILHAREMVLPAPISEGIQSMISAGGGRVGNNASLNYAPTINNNAQRGRGGTGMSRSEFSQMMAMHSGSMFGEAQNMIRSGWRPG